MINEQLSVINYHLSLIIELLSYWKLILVISSISKKEQSSDEGSLRSSREISTLVICD